MGIAAISLPEMMMSKEILGAKLLIVLIFYLLVESAYTGCLLNFVYV